MNERKKTVVITGGTGGIGFQSALGIARDETSPRVVVTGRDEARARKAVESIREATGNPDIHFVTGDLASLSEIDHVAAQLLERFDTIDVLVNNAGSLTTEREETADGVETNFAVNVVAPFRLTQRLRDGLARVNSARVINVTGGMPHHRLDADNLEPEESFQALRSYSNSKRAMEAMSLELAEELAPDGIHLNVVYPGAAATAMTGGMNASSLPWFMRPMWPLFRWYMRRDDGGKSAAKAARSTIWAALTPELEGVCGEYFDANSRPSKFNASVRNMDNRQKVMAAVERVMTRRIGQPRQART